ncbi:MAG: arylamine N-acetyltransferase [Pirellulales bacterium]
METPQTSSVELSKYFARIGYDGPRASDLTTLQAVHFAHATHIPFENIDVLLRKPIRLDLEGLTAKLIDGRRGGYCFEQNALLAAALEALGFRVVRLLARVRVHSGRLLPRTHMVLEVTADNRTWLADVGFGAWGLLDPLPLVDGDSQQYAWKYRLTDQGSEWLLQALVADQWRDMYSFTREAQLPVDFEPGNHYTSTHPDSRFTHTLTAQRPTPETRWLLNNRQLTTATAAGLSTRTLAGDEELLAVLAEVFHLEVPPGAWIPADA